MKTLPMNFRTGRVCRFCVAIITILCHQSILAQNAGSLDLSFGDNGITTFDDRDWATSHSFTVLSDGSILLTVDGDGDRDWILKYDKNGMIDSSFGDYFGKLYLGDPNPTKTYQIISDTNDRFYIYQAFRSNELTCFDDNGNKVKSFGTNGTITDTLGNIGRVELSESGKIRYIVQGADSIPHIVEIDLDGELNSGFGKGGRIAIPALKNYQIWLTSLSDEPKYLMVAKDWDRPKFITKVVEGIGFDTSFGINGFAKIPMSDSINFGISDLEVWQSKAYVLGSTFDLPYDSGVFVYRYTSSGALDSTYLNSNGSFFRPLGSKKRYYGMDLEFQSDGKLIICGTQNLRWTPPIGFFVSRFNENGELDASFSDNGVYEPNLFDESDVFDDRCEVLENGKILVQINLSPNQYPGSYTGLFRLESGLYAGEQKTTFQENKIKVFPNPSNGKFQVVIPGNDNGRLELFNLLGEEVYSAITNLGNTLVSLPSNIRNGVYILRIVNEKSFYSDRIIIRR